MYETWKGEKGRPGDMDAGKARQKGQARCFLCQMAIISFVTTKLVIVFLSKGECNFDMRHAEVFRSR